MIHWFPPSCGLSLPFSSPPFIFLPPTLFPRLSPFVFPSHSPPIPFLQLSISHNSPPFPPFLVLSLLSILHASFSLRSPTPDPRSSNHSRQRLFPSLSPLTLPPYTPALPPLSAPLFTPLPALHAGTGGSEAVGDPPNPRATSPTASFTRTSRRGPRRGSCPPPNATLATPTLWRPWR